LEIGTTRTVLATGESLPNGHLKITSHAEIPSSGVRKSQILDIGQATQSIRSVLLEIERQQEACGTNVTIGNAFLLVSGQHISVFPFSGTVAVETARVTDKSIDDVGQAARQTPQPKEREILDIIEQDYELDNLGGISAPKGMTGRVLKLNTLQIHADRNRIQDARTAAGGAHLEIREPLFAATCAADAALEDHERKNGVLVLDFGGGSTGYAVYSDGYLSTAGVIGVGGDHVTNDIAYAFQTTHAQAEDLKRNASSAIISTRNDESARVKVPGSNPLLEGRTVSRRALDTVVNVRLKELLAIIREKLDERGLTHRLHAGVVLTGGGAAQRDLDGLIQQTLGMNVRHGSPTNVEGLDDVSFPPAFACIAGALLYAQRNYDEKSILDGLFGRFFK